MIDPMIILLTRSIVTMPHEESRAALTRKRPARGRIAFKVIN